MERLTIQPQWEATFIPQDPPRASYFALWDGPVAGATPAVVPNLVAAPAATPAPGGPAGTTRSIRLVVPEHPADVSGPSQQVSVTVRRLAIRDAIEVLSTLPARRPVTPSVRAWAAVVRSGLGLIARGRLLPTVSPAGWDAWRVDPLDAADHRLVDDLAGALPALAHCTPIGETPSVIADPVFAIRACYDALADRFVRTPAAASVASSVVFAQLEPTRVPHLRPWVGDIATRHCAAAVLVIAVDPPSDRTEAVVAEGLVAAEGRDVAEGEAPLGFPELFGARGAGADTDRWTLRFRLRSRRDPSLVIDAAELWRTPAEVAQLLGEQAEVDLLAGLRQAAAACPLIEAALSDHHPICRSLDEDEFLEFLDGLDALTEVGIEVYWPAELVSPNLDRRLVVGTGSGGGGSGRLATVAELLAVNWEFLLDGVALTRSELEMLARAKRSIVPIRGRWVRLDAALRRRLTQPPPELSPGDLLAAALLGEWHDPGDGERAEPVGLRLHDDVARAVADLQRLAAGDDLTEPEPEGLAATLRPYQRTGLAWMSGLCELGLGGLLADDMGLGKTVQILALHLKRGGPSLVVCPTSVITNWEREAATFAPGTRVIRYHGPNRTLGSVSPGDLVLTTYGVVRSDQAKLAEFEFDLVVADEAQQIKNAQSRTARALHRLRGRSRFALSGTPIENHLGELWSIVNWAVPGLLGSQGAFRRELALPIERDGDPLARRRLAALTKPFLLRRRKSDPGIAPELPAKTERNVVVPLTAEQITLYRATTDVVLADVAANRGLVRQGLVLKLLTALKQIANHPAHYLSQSGPLADRSGKLEMLDQLVDRAVEADESTLVFTQYVAMARLLSAHLDDRGVSHGLLHGGLSRTARAHLVDRFQAGELSVLLLSLRAGGTGLNLTRATQVIHYDRWWNPAVEDQATDRAYRIGQGLPVTVHRLITEGTIEDRVAELLDGKRALAERVIGGGADAWLARLDDEELAELVLLEEP